MSRKAAISPLTVALGTVFSVSLVNTTITNAAENPFSMQPVSSAYTTLAEGMGGKGKCGAGKGKGREGMCGMSRMDADSDGKISKDEFVKGHAAKFKMIDQNGDGFIDESEHNAHMKKMMGFMKEGKCGEGKCGGAKK